ncbi:MAG: 5-deoxy-glucuronate isomerase [Clostridiales bacterium]|nr:5-deoxy-glucuronate isomerase [Clostridiales bacterium]
MGRPDYKMRVPDGFGKLMVVAPENENMEFVHMEYLRLRAGETAEVGRPDRECGILLMGGDFTASWADQARSIRGRKDAFSGLPHCVYVPAGRSVRVLADTDFEAAIFGTPAEPGGEVGIICPEDIAILDIGENEWEIHGYFVINSEFPAQKLIIGETQIPIGHWCSVPPHSHEKEIPGKESKLEEIYFFKFKPGQGFGFQGVYTDDRSLDEGYIIRTNDVVLVPRGYHPNVAGPGYEMRMFWGMGGTSRYWTPWEDPDHSWIGKNATSPGDCEW